jgi:TPR repeat protein
LYRPAALKRNANAQYNLGRMYADGGGVFKNNATAVEWYQKAAKQGHTDAQRQLAELAIMK